MAHTHRDRGLPDDVVVLGMTANPEPQQALRDSHRKRPVVQANSHGPIGTDPLKMKRGGSLIHSQKGECPVRGALDVRRQLTIALPKTGCSAVGHSSEERPSA